MYPLRAIARLQGATLRSDVRHNLTLAIAGGYPGSLHVPFFAMLCGFYLVCITPRC